VVSHLLVIGGRSGVGKSSVAFALHDLLAEARVRHAVVEGDTLDLAWPPPWEDRLAERNLRAVWAGYRDLGYRRLVYTHTVSVLQADDLAATMGDDPHVTAVLLTADDATADERLAGREHGESLARHQTRSREAAARLDTGAPAATHRVATDGRTVDEVAALVAELWLGARPAWPADAP